MKVPHHAAIVRFAAQLAPRLAPAVAPLLAAPTTLGALAAGVEAADYYDDVRIAGKSPVARFAAWTQAHVSGGTSLQHFGDARGYCLDDDRYRPRLVDLTADNSATVDYHAEALPVPVSRRDDAPGRALQGQPWAHVFFPSAGQLAEFYAATARVLWRVNDRERALRCAAAAMHLLHDLCVPHHAICTIGLGHSQFEAALWAAWCEWESGSWPRCRWAAWRRLDPEALTAEYLDSLALPPTAAALAARVAAETRRLWVIPSDTPIRSLTGGRASLERAARSCCLAAAATLRLAADALT